MMPFEPTRWHRLVWGVLLLVLWIGPVHAQEDYEISGIRIDGNSSFSDGTLRDLMSLKGHGWLAKTVLGKNVSRYSEDLFEGDLRRITRFYQRRGFLNVRVTRGPFELHAKDRKVALTISIVEGPPVLVDSIAIHLSPQTDDTGEPSDALMAVLVGQLKLHRGERFRDRLVAEDQNAILRTMSDNGYPYATVSADLDVDTLAHRVDVVYQLISGPRCTIGAISVNGAERVSDNLVLRQLPFATGALFRQNQLNEAQRRLIDLGVFEIATVTSVLSTEPDASVPIRITVREAPILSAKVGIGYGREDNVRVFTESRILGFLGGARRLELYAKHSGLEPYHIRLRFTQPSFLDPQTSATLSPFIRRQDEPGFVLTRYGGSAGLDHRFSPSLSGSIDYTFEQVHLDTNSVALADTASTGLTDLYNKSSVLFGLTFDNSQPVFSPNRGYYAALTVKMSGLDLGSDYHFARVLLDLRHYQQVAGVVLATRIELGGISSFDPDNFVPVEDHFFSGGGSSVRGWARGELGPLSDGRPIGGSSLLEGSVELRIPIIGILSGVTFVDAGNVWLDSFDYRIADVRYAAGGGLRVRTPIGPVRLDLARPIFDTETTWQVHINVGEAF